MILVGIGQPHFKQKNNLEIVALRLYLDITWIHLMDIRRNPSMVMFDRMPLSFLLKFYFLAVHNSSIGDLVTHSVSH